MKDKHMIVRIHAHARAQSEHVIFRQRWPVLHDFMVRLAGPERNQRRQKEGRKN